MMAGVMAATTASPPAPIEERGPAAYVAEFVGTFLLVNALGGTSGAHFNPAITSTLTALRKITPQDATIYVMLQFAGAVAAALVAKALLKDEGAAVHYGAPAVSPKTTNLGGFTC